MIEDNVQTMESGHSTSTGSPEFDLFSAMEFTVADILQLRSRVHANTAEKSRFARMIEELPDPGSTQIPEKILRRGVGHWILGQYDHAVECLRRLKGNPVASYLHARSLLARGQPREAREIFEELQKKESTNAAHQTGILSCLEAAEDWEELRKELKGAGKAFQGSADARYFEGRLAETDRRYEEAIASYEKALEKDPSHRASLFRLAYQLDLRGMDEEAISLYERLMHLPPVDTRAAINLGVLYEDRGEYEKAATSFDAVVRAYPTHERARMYLEDAKASLHMFYDEDLEKKEDKLQQILRIPITDFELSVRARNCLAKMEIQTLGDLVKKSETELLAFKNFGETSLNEIKEILRSKGLRLGMTKEDGMIETPFMAPILSPSEVSPEILGKPVTELDLSVRSRRAVDSMGVRTLGELSQHSEKELLEIPNFGQTSLNEIKEKLRAFGLKLSDSN